MSDKIDSTVLLYGLAFMILGKIVWSWLSAGRKNGPVPAAHKADGTCPFHDQSVEMIKGLEAAVMTVKTRCVDRDEFKEINRTFNNKVDSINDKLDSINTSISDIRVEVAKIGSVSQKKTT